MKHQSFRLQPEELLDHAFRFIDVADYANASKILTTVLDINPNNGRALHGLGLIALLTGRHGLAVAMLRQATAHVKAEAPDAAIIWMQLGVGLARCNRTEEALKAHLKAADLDPMQALHYSNAAGCLLNMGRYDEVIRYARKAYSIDSSHADVRWHLALGHLEKGIVTPQVWEWHEARTELDSRNGKKRNYSGNPPMWDGKRVDRLVIHGEQGLGDEIMFASCIPEIETGIDLVVECAPRLRSLFARSFPGTVVVGTHDLEGKDLPEGFVPDAYIPLGSLPRLFRPSIESFPGAPYLIPDTERVSAIRARLPEGKLRVGLAWQGGSQDTRIDLRSVLPSHLGPILGNNCDFVSLQYTTQAAKDAAEMGIHHWAEAEADDMDDVAALVASCDLVISVCTTVVHIAGALGVPCWVLVPSGHAWRYGGTGETMPWYRSVKLFRQKGTNWDETIRKVADGLADYRKLPEAERAASRRAA